MAVRSIYIDEASLTRDSVACLDTSSSPWGQLQIAQEFDYRRGCTDIVAITDDGMVVAFEVKVARWRDALHQAYRNRCFAHQSYVIVPGEAARVASHYLDEFQRRQVGLCSLSDGRIVVLLESPRSDPIQPWLIDRVKELLE